MFSRIVVGIDFSARSIAAARWVAHRFAPTAHVTFVHIMPEPVAPACMTSHLPALLGVLSDVESSLAMALRSVAAQVAPERSATVLRRGVVADELARVANELQADLVCVARRRSRRGGARFGATTAHRLLARGKVPLLVIPRTSEEAPTRIVAALDERGGPRTVIRMSLGLGQTFDAGVQALHVLTPALRDLVRGHRDRSGGAMDCDELHRITHDWLAQQLSSVQAGVPSTHTKVAVGDPGEQILALAHASHADLILLGRGGALRGAGADPSASIGSTTRFVTWAAACPVMVLPTQWAVPTPPRRSRREEPERRLVSSTAGP
jgi:nucleotide-binding universal stress UspA family protein